jgi:Asp-tRNA(Asn)/Glu-tRNA(Gln) amidotransferase A subunit family amidase
MTSDHARFQGAQTVLDDRLYGAWAWVDGEARTSWDRAFGVKDVVDVEGQPTACGFHPWRDRLPDRDAASVALLRRAGWLPVGKTATTQFAYGDPAVTVDPRDPSRTPGGSSTGSAVAVALGHVPLALGTQTGGSVVRPAGYCGVVGVKPTFSAVSVDGVHPLAPSLDTVGLLAASVSVARAAMVDLGVVADGDGTSPSELRVSIPEQPALDGTTSAGFAAAVGALQGDRSVSVRRTVTACDADEVRRVHRVVLAGESWAVHHSLYATLPEHYAPRLRELLAEGRDLPGVELSRARARLVELGQVLRDSIPDRGVVVCPSAPTQAPGRRTTGSSLLATPWTVAQGPVVAVPWFDPVSRARGGMQVIARPGEDALCLHAARVIEAALARAGLHSPPPQPA